MSRLRQIVRGLAAGAVIAAALLGRDTVAQSIVLPGTLSGNQTWNATSGAATVTGNSTLSGTVTLGLGFEVEYLVVGGGGGGGSNKTGGGGGAGGFTTGTNFVAGGQALSVFVGAGGASGNNGQSSALGSFTAGGGGAGATYVFGGSSASSGAGGSGGGGAGGGAQQSGGIATGNGLGNSGGAGFYAFPSDDYGGGGGGAGGAGANAANFKAGDGGVGRNSNIGGTNLTYAGGGGGSSPKLADFTNPSLGYIGEGKGGEGGGGDSGQSGSAGYGGGGGGNGGSGGSGIVIARYRGSSFAEGGTIDPGSQAAAGYTLHRFSAVGGSSFVIPDLGSRLNATYDGSLSGSGGIIFNGPGTLTLAGSNTYTGSTTASAGTLIATSTAALPGFATAGRVIFGGGTLQLPMGAAWTGAQVDSLVAGATKTSGVLALGVASGTQALSGPISGGIGLTKFGGGTLTLSASNSFSGPNARRLGHAGDR